MIKIENILNCLINNLNLGIHIVDNDGKTIYYNDVMASIEGLNKDEVMGKKVDEYLEDVDEESSTIIKCIKSRKKVKDVIQRYSSNIGKKITTINTTIPVMENNELIGAIEIAQDMTQFKEVNEKLCKLQSVLKSSQDHYVFNDIVGNSDALNGAINKAMRASLSNSPVLIYGETGCGKEVTNSYK
ncbi:PAS domain S-box protein [Haloimpatiens lingqiaonensis]|uniref:PAS domain S-box protein n=1 Tax=Haloimpatiens lingqiaonensis TaxID=1380675 RepID=UPI0010FEBB4A|nr:PAS domain S-box protein [Haloimpatiens lingqiaonensis]